MIQSFKHAGLERFFHENSKRGIQPHHATKLARLLTQLNVSKSPLDMGVAGWDCHELTGNLKKHFSVKVDGNWRMTFKFEGEDAILVDYQDYH